MYTVNVATVTGSPQSSSGSLAGSHSSTPGNLFSILIVLPFLECHRNEIAEYTAIRLTSLICIKDSEIRLVLQY